MATPQIKKAYEPHERVQLKCLDESRTKQAMRDECDVNKIMQQYEKNGLIEHVNKYQGSYADVADAPGYLEGMNTVIRANEMFDSLPSSVRNHFDNDPAIFLAFADDPANHAEMVSMGLRKEAPNPVEKVVAADPAAAKPPLEAEKAPTDPVVADPIQFDPGA